MSPRSKWVTMSNDNWFIPSIEHVNTLFASNLDGKVSQGQHRVTSHIKDSEDQQGWELHNNRHMPVNCEISCKNKGPNTDLDW